jgi:midasin
MSNIFPTFEDDSEQDAESTQRLNSKDLSVRLSQLVGTLFVTQDKAEVLRSLILATSNLVGKTMSKLSGPVSPVDPKAHLSAVLLMLEGANQAGAPESFNFYEDSHPVEAERLVQLTEKVLRRFTVIQKTWPEHATLADVIGCCLQILEFKHREPLAKFITKVEQLQGFVHAWQSVTSKEFSAADCYDDLTTLIIRWRRLELSTWACLLAIEKTKCENDAAAWWFVAYDVILAVPLQMIEEGRQDDIVYHTVDLIGTLERFLHSTPMGQYAFRLRLVEQLKSLLDTYAVDSPALAHLSSALDNLLHHYAPFIPGIETSLNEGRQALEKDIKQEIQLASWKDTNITALRESARRSHKKLFKVVRKYRGLLRQPCDGLLGKGYIRIGYQEDQIDRPPLREPGAVPPDALSTCSSSPNWTLMPPRFRDPEASVGNMRRIYQQSLVDFEVVGEIDAFVRDVVATIASFKSKTPKALTDENKDEVQHLKVQKRRFYAEKLKDLKLMGIQSNLGSDILSRQSSVRAVLAAIPSLPNPDVFHPIESADSYFHRFLDLVPRARMAARDYAEDLSNVEVARSAGFVEGLMSRAIKQREKISAALKTFPMLESVVVKMVNMSSLRNSELRSCNSVTPVKQGLQGCLRWLGTTVGVCLTILQIQSKFASSGPDDVLEGLGSIKEHCSNILSSLDELIQLPHALSSSVHDRAAGQAQTFLADTKSRVSSWISAYPEFAFALEHLLPWTEPDTLADSLMGGVKDSGDHIQDFDATLTAAIDKILIAVQRLKACLPAAPSSAEDQGWFVKSDQVLSRATDELHIQEITTSLISALGQLARLSPDNKHAFVLGTATACALLPIVQQYHSICYDMLHRHISLHRETCKMGYLLANSFIQIASEGFCSPKESSAEQGKSDKLEKGTGLGEGEGAEDISKDVQDDEDLSELAQQKDESGEKEEEMATNDDAVNMDHDDLEADANDVDKESGDDEEKSDMEGEEEELDEEVGSVDGLEESAVDEKLWDGAKDEDQKDTENNEGKGDQADEQAAASEAKADENPKEGEGNKEDENEFSEEEEAPDDEGEAIGRDDIDVTDPHAKEEQVLDLPEDMDLDGQEKGDESETDDGFDDMSITEDDKLEDLADEKDVVDSPKDGDETMDEVADAEEGQADEGPNPEDELDKPEDNKEQGDVEEGGDDEALGAEDVAPSDAVSAGLRHGPDEEKGESGNAAQEQESAEQTEQHDQEGGAAAPEGKDSKQGTNDTGDTGDQGMEDAQEQQAFRKLGDILEQWHRRQHKIKESSEQPQVPEENRQVDMEQAEFEHLADDQEAADTQALGQADEEQVQGIDQSKGIESDMKPRDDETLPDAGDADDAVEQPTLEDQMQVEYTGSSLKQQPQLPSFIPSEERNGSSPSGDNLQTAEMDEDLDNVDNDLSAIHLSAESGSLTSPEEARRLWSHYESATHDLSLALTEQLRLILAPTMATKLRGDFRTGKRLNIKRIIPYIASQYKRDKIWMRRSVPSKRNYQIMLAVDDSKSMLENGSGQLAFETLALVARSLSMLEAGDLCVVSFGGEEHIRVAHEFGKPFSSEAGMQVFQQFSYKQTGTNVRRLVADSIALFRDARTKQSSNSRTGDLWQLQLVISDGICEDHDTIRRLVRQAQEERIMIVFIIVDAVTDESRSIMQLTQASFEPDESGGGGGGRWKMRRYLDNFPFPYYLIVRDVQELPAVLSLALKQWFAEVAESS